MAPTRPGPSPPTPAAAAATPATPSPLLRAVRRLRTFSLTHWVGHHPYMAYGILAATFVAYCNVTLARHFEGYYPDYDAIRASGRTKGLANAKLQELADVQRYNNLVSDMRADIRGRPS